MKDYYQVLGVDQSTSAEEIKKAVSKGLRLWTTRQAAPDFNARQEAERMVADLEEAEKVLLDASQRAEYDAKLQEWRKSKSNRQSSASDTGEETGNLIELGWQHLIDGDVAEALHYATKATEENAKDPEAWALLGQARYRWGDHDDAIYEYRRAIKLKPNEASYYFDLASVFESKGEFKEACNQFERASKTAPDEIPYRAAVGQIYIRLERLDEGTSILENCVQQDPNNDTYRWLLARAYIANFYEGWTHNPEDNLYYATSKADVLRALDKVSQAEALKPTDQETLEDIAEMRTFIESNMKRKFRGSIMTPIAGGLAWLLIGGIGIIFGPLYYFASRTPQYSLNRQVLAGEATFDERMSGSGLVGLFIGVVLLPVMAVVNLIRNYTGENWIAKDGEKTA